jgi:hypothetical protein
MNWSSLREGDHKGRPYRTTFFVGAGLVPALASTPNGTQTKPSNLPKTYSYLERRNKWFSARRKLSNLERGAFSGVKATP